MLLLVSAKTLSKLERAARVLMAPRAASQNSITRRYVPSLRLVDDGAWILLLRYGLLTKGSEVKREAITILSRDVIDGEEERS
jgi:hypothetical protein